MKLTTTVKLQPNPEQATALVETMRRANTACNALSRMAWDARSFRQYDIHHLGYGAVREQTGLSAQVVVRCIAKVADAYKLDRKRFRSFRPMGAVAYDSRILRWFDDAVSIWTVEGRQRIPFTCGEDARNLLSRQRGETDLVFRDGMWFLYTTVEVDDVPVSEPDTFLGVDFGIVNIVADSDGDTYSGGQVNGLRRRYRRVRARLQSKGTKSAKRLLRKRRRKEQRFAKDINHQISKRLVAKAKDTGRGIALEDLSGIRDRVTARRPQRATLHSWSFHQLRSYITYKAARSGVMVEAVDPRNTSRTCPECGCIDKANRKHRDSFLCVSCGLAGPADSIAAVNIRRRAEVNRPNVCAVSQSESPTATDKPPALAVGC